MVEKLPQHKHCRVCRKAVLVTDDFCDDMCKAEYKAMMRKKRNSYILLMLFAMFAMFMAFALGA
jgi:predicted nucleic acid-binding Zn ribbon protein